MPLKLFEGEWKLVGLNSTPTIVAEVLDDKGITRDRFVSLIHPGSTNYSAKSKELLTIAKVMRASKEMYQLIKYISDNAGALEDGYAMNKVIDMANDIIKEVEG